MTRTRILVSGMGGELGSLLATKLERQFADSTIVGVDIDPPRRRLRFADFHLVRPDDEDRLSSLAAEFSPHLVFHLAVYEPNARASASEAALWTPAASRAVVGGAAAGGSLEHVVMRSGIEVYGRLADRHHRPDIYVPVNGSTPFGAQLIDVETNVRRVAGEIGATASLVRLAPVLGSHIPSPLGRLLRLPAVPCRLLGDPHFSVCDDELAADALIAAAQQRFDGPINVLAPGDVSVRGALRIGKRFAVGLLGPQWLAAKPLVRLAGAPIPDHVTELLVHGRLAAGPDLTDVLGVRPRATTVDVIRALYSWEAIRRYPAGSRLQTTDTVTA